MLFATSSLSRRLVFLHIRKQTASTNFISPTVLSRRNSILPIPSTTRWYTPITSEEEEIEKARVSHLSPEEKDKELRDLNRQLARLEKLRGINTGEIYTWSGRYKALMRDYALPLFMWYWCCWCTMGVGVYLAIDLGGLDAMQLIARGDYALSQLTGSEFDLVSKVDPQLGKIGVTLVLNEMLEPFRLPFVVVTLKPTMDYISPPKY